MMMTERGKILVATVLAIAVVGGLSYVQYGQEKQIESLKQSAPITVTKIVEVTPTSIPTATPAATLKYTPVIKTVTPVVKGAVK